MFLHRVWRTVMGFVIYMAGAKERLTRGGGFEIDISAAAAAAKDNLQGSWRTYYR